MNASNKRVKSERLNRWLAMVHDVFMLPVAWLLAYWLRFNLDTVPADMLSSAVSYLWLIIPLQTVFFLQFGLYRGVWRFASVPDLIRIIKSVAFGLIAVMACLFVIYRLEGVPRSVPVLYGGILIMLLSGPRLMYRWLKDHQFTFGSGQRVLIVGAGKAGEILVRDLLQDDAYQPIAFVDDKLRRIGQEIHGVPVIAECNDIPRIVEKLSIEVIVLAIPSASLEQRKHLVSLCENAAVPFRSVPQLESLMSGQVAVNQLREVSIEDLLGRSPVILDWDGIRGGLSGKTVLVTGAGGSIGSELCRQLARLGPERLVLLENSEFNLYNIERELIKLYPDLSLVIRLGDVRDAVFVDSVFRSYCPNVVFHAAAYKHVPMLEHQIRQAVQNNVMGTRIVADAADQYDCAEFVLISTDKAVNPTNIMGTTKRVAEIYCQNLSTRSSTKYITVRFGNVLGSAGSVVPLFREQIAKGGPVTVTHPDMERFFMTIPEACQLIMQASVLGEGGEIFILEMGSPVKISYLAEQMIRLSGREPEKDIEIVYTGLRPGEKLFEELFHEKEALASTNHEKILLARHRIIEWNELLSDMDRIQEAINADTADYLMEVLRKLVPEHHLQKAPCLTQADSNRTSTVFTS